jgi:hypothetical protein
MGFDRQMVIELYRQDQPIEELRRKAEKARCRSNLWTQEELDLADKEAAELYRYFHPHS